MVLDPVTLARVRPNNGLLPREVTQPLLELSDEHKLLIDPVHYGFSLGDKICGEAQFYLMTDWLVRC